MTEREKRHKRTRLAEGSQEIWASKPSTGLPNPTTHTRLKRSDVGAHRGSAATTGQNSSVPPRVLIADDNADARDIYTAYLTWAGYEVATAEDGERALELVERLRPDVVVMDASMPKLDGWKATRALKERTPDLPVILVTAGLAEDGESSASDYDLILVKPCLPQSLEQAVREVLAAHGRRRASSSGARPAPPNRDPHKARVRRVHG